MARPRKEKELLVVVPVRLPADFVASLDEEANKSGYSRSDVLRMKISSGKADAPINTTGKQTPRKRERLMKATAADPRLILAISQIGNNVNQIAKAINIGVVSGNSYEIAKSLLLLEQIERHLEIISSAHGGMNAD